MKNYSWLKAGLAAAGISVFMSLASYLSSYISCIGCLILPITCLLWFALPLGAGFLAATWAKLERDQFSEAIKQGVLAGLVLGIISGAFSFALNIIASILNLSVLNSLDILGNSDANSYLGNYISYSFGLPLQALCCTAAVFLDMVLSTLGGIIKVALLKK
ncbi:MAG: hypothetical protein ABIE03_04270 [Patescibacteria group bacterium]|nr:hypothetical protein [Patescibacteria group bacterium]